MNDENVETPPSAPTINSPLQDLSSILNHQNNSALENKNNAQLKIDNYKHRKSRLVSSSTSSSELNLSNDFIDSPVRKPSAKPQMDNLVKLFKKFSVLSPAKRTDIQNEFGNDEELSDKENEEAFEAEELVNDAANSTKQLLDNTYARDMTISDADLELEDKLLDYTLNIDQIGTSNYDYPTEKLFDRKDELNSITPEKRQSPNVSANRIIVKSNCVEDYEKSLLAVPVDVSGDSVDVSHEGKNSTVVEIENKSAKLDELSVTNGNKSVVEHSTNVTDDKWFDCANWSSSNHHVNTTNSSFKLANSATATAHNLKNRINEQPNEKVGENPIEVKTGTIENLQSKEEIPTNSIINDILKGDKSTNLDKNIDVVAIKPEVSKPVIESTSVEQVPVQDAIDKLIHPSHSPNHVLDLTENFNRRSSFEFANFTLNSFDINNEAINSTLLEIPNQSKIQDPLDVTVNLSNEKLSIDQQATSPGCHIKETPDISEIISEETLNKGDENSKLLHDFGNLENSNAKDIEIDNINFKSAEVSYKSEISFDTPDSTLETSIDIDRAYTNPTADPTKKVTSRKELLETNQLTNLTNIDVENSFKANAIFEAVANLNQDGDSNLSENYMKNDQTVKVDLTDESDMTNPLVVLRNSLIEEVFAEEIHSQSLNQNQVKEAYGDLNISNNASMLESPFTNLTITDSAVHIEERIEPIISRDPLQLNDSKIECDSSPMEINFIVDAPVDDSIVSYGPVEQSNENSVLEVSAELLENDATYDEINKNHNKRSKIDENDFSNSAFNRTIDFPSEVKNLNSFTPKLRFDYKRENESSFLEANMDDNRVISPTLLSLESSLINASTNGCFRSIGNESPIKSQIEIQGTSNELFDDNFAEHIETNENSLNILADQISDASKLNETRTIENSSDVLADQRIQAHTFENPSHDLTEQIIEASTASSIDNPSDALADGIIDASNLIEAHSIKNPTHVLADQIIESLNLNESQTLEKSTDALSDQVIDASKLNDTQDVLTDQIIERSNLNETHSIENPTDALTDKIIEASNLNKTHTLEKSSDAVSNQIIETLNSNETRTLEKPTDALSDQIIEASKLNDTQVLETSASIEQHTEISDTFDITLTNENTSAINNSRSQADISGHMQNQQGLNGVSQTATKVLNCTQEIQNDFETIEVSKEVSFNQNDLDTQSFDKCIKEAARSLVNLVVNEAIESANDCETIEASKEVSFTQNESDTPSFFDECLKGAAGSLVNLVVSEANKVSFNKTESNTQSFDDCVKEVADSLVNLVISDATQSTQNEPNQQDTTIEIKDTPEQFTESGSKYGSIASDNSFVIQSNEINEPTQIQTQSVGECVKEVARSLVNLVVNEAIESANEIETMEANKEISLTQNEPGTQSFFDECLKGAAGSLVNLVVSEANKVSFNNNESNTQSFDDCVKEVADSLVNLVISDATQSTQNEPNQQDTMIEIKDTSQQFTESQSKYGPIASDNSFVIQSDEINEPTQIQTQSVDECVKEAARSLVNLVVNEAIESANDCETIEASKEISLTQNESDKQSFFDECLKGAAGSLVNLVVSEANKVSYNKNESNTQLFDDCVKEVADSLVNLVISDATQSTQNEPNQQDKMIEIKATSDQLTESESKYVSIPSDNSFVIQSNEINEPTQIQTQSVDECVKEAARSLVNLVVNEAIESASNFETIEASKEVSCTQNETDRQSFFDECLKGVAGSLVNLVVSEANKDSFNKNETNTQAFDECVKEVAGSLVNLVLSDASQSTQNEPNKQDAIEIKDTPSDNSFVIQSNEIIESTQIQSQNAACGNEATSESNMHVEEFNNSIKESVKGFSNSHAFEGNESIDGLYKTDVEIESNLGKTINLNQTLVLAAKDINRLGGSCDTSVEDLAITSNECNLEARDMLTEPIGIVLSNDLTKNSQLFNQSIGIASNLSNKSFSIATESNIPDESNINAPNNESLDVGAFTTTATADTIRASNELKEDSANDSIGLNNSLARSQSKVSNAMNTSFVIESNDLKISKELTTTPLNKSFIIESNLLINKPIEGLSSGLNTPVVIEETKMNQSYIIENNDPTKTPIEGLTSGLNKPIVIEERHNTAPIASEMSRSYIIEKSEAKSPEEISSCFKKSFVMEPYGSSTLACNLPIEGITSGLNKPLVIEPAKKETVPNSSIPSFDEPGKDVGLNKSFVMETSESIDGIVNLPATAAIKGIKGLEVRNDAIPSCSGQNTPLRTNKPTNLQTKMQIDSLFRRSGSGEDFTCGDAMNWKAGELALNEMYQGMKPRESVLKSFDPLLTNSPRPKQKMRSNLTQLPEVDAPINCPLLDFGVQSNASPFGSTNQKSDKMGSLVDFMGFNTPEPKSPNAAKATEPNLSGKSSRMIENVSNLVQISPEHALIAKPKTPQHLISIVPEKPILESKEFFNKTNEFFENLANTSKLVNVTPEKDADKTLVGENLETTLVQITPPRRISVCNRAFELKSRLEKLIKTGADKSDIAKVLEELENEIYKVDILSKVKNFSPGGIRSMEEESRKKLQATMRKCTLLESTQNENLEEFERITQEKKNLEEKVHKCTYAFNYVISNFESIREQVKTCVKTEKDLLQKIDQQIVESEYLESEYNAIKTRAKTAIDNCNAQYAEMKNSNDSESLKLRMLLRRYEMEFNSLEQTLKRQTEQCDELNRIRMELTSHNLR